MQKTKVQDLAVIGDQKTCALISKNCEVVWYCPGKFDNSALFASLLDSEKGGGIELEVSNLLKTERSYWGDSGILNSTLYLDNGTIRITDFMPITKDGCEGIIRDFSNCPENYKVIITPAPNFGRDPLSFNWVKDYVEINKSYHCYGSHPFIVDNDRVIMEVSANETAWFFLANAPVKKINQLIVDSWREETFNNWKDIVSHITYYGPYEREVAESIRAVRLLTYGPNGGILAAATTSLPEVAGEARNYDYRYTWLRDTGMIVSALIRAGSDGIPERKFLSFICDTAHKIPNYEKIPLFTITQTKAPEEESINFSGYKKSQPVRTGNSANSQLQLDALGNVLIAAKLIYNRYETREHWDIITDVCDFVVDNWKEPDYGLWEESTKRQFTSSKVIIAKGIEFIARFCESDKQKKYWLDTAKKIREFVGNECLTSRGEYAAFAGSNAVDVSAALFPLWDYTAADTNEMIRSIDHIEKNYCRDNLYWRHLEDVDSRKEGAFLAGTFWMAQYYIFTNNLERGKQIIDTALKYSTDLGYFSEEADPNTGDMLGNFPQTFVHSSFIGAVVDLKEKMNK